MAEKHPTDCAYDALGVSRLMAVLLRREDLDGVNPHDLAYMFEHIADLSRQGIDGLERAAQQPKPKP